MNNGLKKTLYEISPVFLRRIVSGIKRKISNSPAAAGNHGPGEQALDLYWTEDMAKILDEWGADNAWNEIQMVMSVCKGKVLDVACGTGKTIEILNKFPQIEVHGCDISDLLIKKASDRGIPAERLKVCDATATGYPENFFDYSYSIGSLEHFTEDGIIKFIAECHRITRLGTFHMVPVSRSAKDEGWITPLQSYFNNSESWWLANFRKSYANCYAIPSKWEDQYSYGRWFLCFK
jgi:ubiquinone/menaquinone biosynthesis C-methylase UbiE